MWLEGGTQVYWHLGSKKIVLYRDMPWKKKEKLFIVSSSRKKETKGIHFFLMENFILIVFASRSAQKETVDYNLLR